MRKLNFSDAFRFGRMIQATKSGPVIDSILKGIAACSAADQEQLPEDLQEFGAAIAALPEQYPGDNLEIGKQAAAILSASRPSNDADYTQLGIDAFISILGCAFDANAEKSVYAFLGPVFETSPKELETMSIDAVIANVARLFAENNLVSFFKSARQLTGYF